MLKLNNKISRIVCVGSSTTLQDWCHPNWKDWLSYTFHEQDDWENAWRTQIIDSSRDGAQIDFFIENFEYYIDDLKPNIVIVSLGLNQLLPEFDAQATEIKLDELFAKIKSLGVELVTWAPYAIPNQKNTDVKIIRDIYEKLAHKHKAVFIDIYTEFLKYDLNKLFTFTNNENKVWGFTENEIDYIHCNVVGNQIIAEKIAKEAFGMELLDWEFGTMKLLNLEKYKK